MFHQLVGVGNQQAADGQHALQDVVVVHHEDFVGVVGQAVEAAQVAQHHFAGNVGADAEQFEVHDGPDLVVCKRHGGLYLCTLFFVTGLQDFGDDLVRQVVGQLGQIIGIHVFHRRQQLLVAHAFDQGFAYGVGHFQQHIAVVFGCSQLPGQHPLLERQGLEHGGHVGRVQFVQGAGEFVQVAVEAFVEVR